MTSNQIAAERNREEARSNRENEAVKRRDSRSKEREQDRKDKEFRRETGKQAVEFGERILGYTPWGTMQKIKNSVASNFGRLIGSANDPEWYNLNPDLTRDAASISFETPLRNGVTLATEGNSSMFPSDLTNDYAVDTILHRASMVNLQWIPTIGKGSLHSTTPVNVAAQNIYSWVRHANSGHANYEPSDIMMYLLALSEAYKYYAWGRLIYKVANSQFPQDVNFVKAFQACTGVQIDDYRQNLADFRYYLNTVATRLNALYVPSKFPYFNRHIWLAANVFKDSPIKKSAYYVFRPYCVGVYKEGSASEATGSLVMTALSDSTPGSYKTLMDGVLNAIINSEDIGIISGDIKKAYGDNLFTIEATPVDDYINPVYSEEVLAQINNISFAMNEPLGGVKSSWHIHQYPGNHQIYQGLYHADIEDYLNDSHVNPNFPLMENALTRGSYIPAIEHSALINTYVEQPKPEFVLVYSRFTNIQRVDQVTGITTGSTYPDSCGSEVVLFASVAYAERATDGSWSWQHEEVYRNRNTERPVSQGIAAKTLSLPALTSQIDWFPRYSTTLFDSNGLYDKSSYLIAQDIDNFAVVNTNSLDNMHSCALLSQFDIPMGGYKG